jgi:hypothetical protein
MSFSIISNSGFKNTDKSFFILTKTVLMEATSLNHKSFAIFFKLIGSFHIITKQSFNQIFSQIRNLIHSSFSTFLIACKNSGQTATSHKEIQ